MSEPQKSSMSGPCQKQAAYTPSGVTCITSRTSNGAVRRARKIRASRISRPMPGGMKRYPRIARATLMTLTGASTVSVVVMTVTSWP